MPASPKQSMKRQPRLVPTDPWSGWLDVAIGIGQTVVAYELMLVAALSPAAPPHRARLALVRSRAGAAAAPARSDKRPALQSVPRRDEGKA